MTIDDQVLITRLQDLIGSDLMFDPGMTMCAQVANITKAANFQLVNIGRARKMLTTEATKLAVHILVTSRLDYCNSLLVGVSDTLLKRLQNIQSTAARLITKKRKYDSITPELISRHWLPIRQRIAFKILVLVYKSLHQQTQLHFRHASCKNCSKAASLNIVIPTFHRTQNTDYVCWQIFLLLCTALIESTSRTHEDHSFSWEFQEAFKTSSFWTGIQPMTLVYLVYILYLFYVCLYLAP